eukprot:11184863-Lingulodinium_polyedra.AAC.1
MKCADWYLRGIAAVECVAEGFLWVLREPRWARLVASVRIAQLGAGTMSGKTYHATHSDHLFAGKGTSESTYTPDP